MRLTHILVVASVTLVSGDTRQAIQADALLTHIKFLASDDLEGRGNGSPGLDRAGDYIAAQWKAAGLQPGGKNGSWFQPFELVTSLSVGEGNTLTVRSGGQSIAFALGQTYFPLSATANDSTREASANAQALPLIFAGYGISASSLNYDDYAGIDVTGKAVLVFTHEPQEHDAASRFNGREFTANATLLSKAMTARTRGAKLLLIVSDPTHDRDEAPYQGFIKDPQAEDYGIPVLRVQRDRIEPLLAAWKLDMLAKEIDSAGAPRSRALAGAAADYVEHLAKTRRTVRNVIGVLPGSNPARKNEAIVLGAHYDHLGLGGRHSMNPNLAGQIHNGADDNASGTAALIEIARAAAANHARFQRSVIFVAFAGEELGLLGSAQYVNSPAVPLDDTVAMVNLDMVGRPRGRIMISGLESAPAVDDDVKAAAATVAGLEIKRFQEGAGVGSSDDTTFMLKKIPAIGFFSGFHSDYHRPTDDWPLIDGAGAATVATLAYELTARLAERPDRPQYVAPPTPTGHGTSTGDAGSVGGYGPYFGSVPDFGEADSGVKFAEVRENSPAAKAGLKAGDVMVSFDGKPIRTLYDFTYALREKKPGDEVEVKVMRGTEAITVKVALTTRP